MSRSVMVWDLGATKCAASLVRLNDLQGEYDCTLQTVVKLSDVNSLNELIDCVESNLNCAMSEADAICIGAAGQYDGRELFLQGGYPFQMNFAESAKKRSWTLYDIVHDYATVVCATFTPYLKNEHHLQLLKTGVQEQHGRRVALGIGTGLGIKDAILLKNGDFWLGRNEAGHIGLICPQDVESSVQKRHHDLVSFLANRSTEQRYSPISFETILSGQGLVRLFEFLYPSQSSVSPEEVGASLAEGKYPELQSMFAWYLGLYIASIELLFMPEGGSWITGGVALHLCRAFHDPAFFKGIEAVPAYQQERKRFSLGVMLNKDHAFWGGAYYACQTFNLTNVRKKYVIEAA